jgi:hypothetical protein
MARPPKPSPNHIWRDGEWVKAHAQGSSAQVVNSGGGNSAPGPQPAAAAATSTDGDWNAQWRAAAAAYDAAAAAQTATGPSQDQQSAYAYMAQLLNQYGLGSLTGALQNLINGGTLDEASITLALQETPEWKTRFAGNEQLRAAGLPVLSVGEYLATERQYAQIMKNYGLPEGFYDDPSDFAGFMGKSVSANELNQRMTAWSDLAHRQDPAIKEQLRGMGIADGDLTAYMMDPTRAMPLIQQKYQQALVGAAARRNGLNSNNDRTQHLVELGITEQQAIQGYGLIAENLTDSQRTGSIYGEDISQADMEAEVFEQDGAATKKRKRLASRERAAFSGSSGVGQGSLTRGSGGSY